MPLSMIQDDMFITFSPDDERKDFANLLLVAGGEGLKDPLMNAMNRSWTLKDAGLETKKLRATDRWSLRSRRVFLSDKVVHRPGKLIRRSKLNLPTWLMRLSNLSKMER